eukprot:2740220-Amphidinium_carterae.1
MVQTKRSSTTEQSKNASVVAQERTAAQQRRDLMKILKRHEAAVGPALLHLRNLGYSAESEVAAVPKSHARLAREANLEKANQVKAEESLLLQSEGGKDLIGPKHGVLGALTAKQLQERVLPALNSSILSAANMCQAMKSVKPRDRLQLLLRHVEYFTGLPASFPLTDECARWPGLLKRLKMESERRSRLSARTSIPVDFDTRGLFDID